MDQTASANDKLCKLLFFAAESGDTCCAAEFPPAKHCRVAVELFGHIGQPILADDMFARETPVKSRHQNGDSVDGAALHRSRLHAIIEHVAGEQTAHFHYPVNSLPNTAHTSGPEIAIRRAANRYDGYVGLSCQPSIEAKLLEAEGAAPGDRAGRQRRNQGKGSVRVF
ncbi:hypothetical protein [Rhizobium leguminosarum]|uniref:hypothetical protein n=1 Tax=Rhizobium leguminosarum TaxID=384 RepID=UPI000DD97E4A|nr:hypothetical protein [Rhizobium leguminosarum]